MKKFGFTLAEVLIALSIIGVIAAMTAPLIDNAMPDKNKLLVLKYHKVISDINRELLDDPGLYDTYMIVNDVFCEGLGCDQKHSKYNDDEAYKGWQKYPKLFADKMNLSGEPAINEGLSSYSFVVKDGVAMDIKMLSNGSVNPLLPNPRPSYTYQILLDVNGDGGCLYGSDDCKKPDRFAFNIDNLGKVTGVDPLTNAYLENPMKLNNKKVDYDRAKELIKK